MSVVDVSAILWALVGGTVVGLVGKWLAPGDRDEVPLWVTVLAGVVGVVAATLVHGVFFERRLTGFDWWRHAWQLLGALLVVLTVVTALGRDRERQRV